MTPPRSAVGGRGVSHLEKPKAGKEDFRSFRPGQLGFEVVLLSSRWPLEMAPGTYLAAEHVTASPQRHCSAGLEPWLTCWARTLLA